MKQLITRIIPIAIASLFLATFAVMPTAQAVVDPVSYDAGGGTGVVPTDSTIYNPGDTVTVLANTGPLTMTGHTFAGWNDGVMPRQPADTFAYSAPVVLTAVWTTDVYTVTYDGNGNTSGTPASPSTYTYGDPAYALPGVGTLVRAGYAFGGWSTTPTGAAVADPYTPTGTEIL